MTEHTPDHIPPTTADDWAAKSARHEGLRAEAAPINRAAVFATLAAGGVTDVTVSFDGYGDSGQIENIEAKAGDAAVELSSTQVEWTVPVWDNGELERVQISLREAIENVVYDCLEKTHRGWENDEGAYGDVTLDVAARTVTLDYNERHTESNYSQHIW